MISLRRLFHSARLYIEQSRKQWQDGFETLAQSSGPSHDSSSSGNGPSNISNTGISNRRSVVHEINKSDSGKGDITGVYWPVIKAQLKDADDWDRLQVTCGICLGDLVFSGINRQRIERCKQNNRPAAINPMGEPAEVAYILCCGHIIGHHCLQTLLDVESQQRGDEDDTVHYCQLRKPACPFCKCSLRHKVCECPVDGLLAPYNMESLAKFPRTPPPEDNLVYEDCSDCAVKGLIRTLELIGALAYRGIANITIHKILDGAERQRILSFRSMSNDKRHRRPLPHLMVDVDPELEPLQRMARATTEIFVKDMQRYWSSQKIVEDYATGRLDPLFVREPDHEDNDDNDDDVFGS